MENKRVKKSIRSEEARAMLGLAKGTWNRLIHQNVFKTYTIMRRFRIDLESFEDWYAGQWHYRKVDGPLPGAKYPEYFSSREIGDLLGIRGDRLQRIIRDRAKLTPYQINGNRCYLRSEFDKWYQSQNQ